jgi:hypothetical protein
MTAQIPEKLLMNGETLTLCSEPLDDYFTSHGEPGFAVNCTALWRGYVGTWEIRDARLFLVGIEAEYPDGSSVSLAKLFQGEAERIFARWFTGTLRCPRGGELEYVHMGYGSVYEEDLLLQIEQGNLVGQEVQVNGTAAHNARQGFRPAAFTTFPRSRKTSSETPE